MICYKLLPKNIVYNFIKKESNDTYKFILIFNNVEGRERKKEYEQNLKVHKLLFVHNSRS